MNNAVLVADMGGTNARFAMADDDNGVISIRDVRKFHARDYQTAHDAIAGYLSQLRAAPKSACFAVAGPVTDDQVEFTNSPWVLNIAGIKPAFSLTRFHVVNDFEALAAGVGQLHEDEWIEAIAGKGVSGAPTLVLGPGTGLGQALIVPDAGRQTVLATEGGHVAFAPQTDEEMAVLKFLRTEHPRVSIERVLSGAGIVNLYRALCSRARAAPVHLKADDITAAAMAGGDAIAMRAVNLFCEILGRAAGDAVLATGARGGVYLGGGILPNIRGLFLQSAFAACFHDKGRMRYFLEGVPVRMIVGEHTALKGAALLAGLSAGSR